ncbi:discoidin domain-containing protein [Aestuariibacter halophilus]|uniref:Discoidin domain-containing protein n=1 Tax=Fluctibacter halophilus TaxID=226011 RepID=A0ABS8G6Z3_9ALTE|nr:discoidin domain-containing protein [Aestuariibacter halophilus]MCC2615001.1 discoidin domain-containing protein [Aestuariibacter halophilus]
MKHSILAGAISAALALPAQATTVDGYPNELTVDQDGQAFLRLFIPDGEGVPCAAESYHFAFATQEQGQTWMDMLAMARQLGQNMRFAYDETDCTLLSVTLPAVFDDGGTTDIGGMTETGILGNVALIGTNNLVEASYSASAHYALDTPAGAFDGYSFLDKINEDAGEKISRGIWMAKTRDSDRIPVNPWVQVDFGKAVRLSGLRVVVNDKSIELGRSPRNVSLYVSNNGTDFAVFESTTLDKLEGVQWDFSRGITARYFRLMVKSNYGDPNFAEIDELEYFQ